jgi:hypothetical protein
MESNARETVAPEKRLKTPVLLSAEIMTGSYV